MDRLRSAIDRAFHYASIVLFLAVLVLVIRSDAYPLKNMLDQRLGVLTAGKRFDIFTWEVGAVSSKAWQLVRGAPVDDQSSQYVRDFFDLASQIQQLRDEAERLAGQEPRPTDRLAEIEKQLKELYAQRDAMENTAENILAAQVTKAMQEKNLQSRVLFWDLVFPPVTSEFVDLPLMLIVSPRDRIERISSYLLIPTLTVDEMEAIEDAIFKLNYSGLVTHLGGLSTYPAMVAERYGLGFALDTMPHEWTHDFLGLHPLGWRYGVSGELTTMNETTADLIGSAVGQQVARDYYPEYVVSPTPTPAPSPSPTPTQQAPTFDFSAEMRKTRLHVDELLSQGKVVEAESYMEDRRQFLADNGYYIRKLNQAYFAFHGSYATGPGSVSPIGGQLQELLRQSGSLRDFLFSVSSMTSYEDLLRAIGQPTPTATPAP